jgi:hypothetical protein
LHAAASGVRSADPAAFEQADEVRGAARLARMRAYALYAFVERIGRAALRVRGHGADDVGGLGQHPRLLEFKAAERKHRLRPVHQRDSFFREQRHRSDSRAAQRFPALQAHAFELGFPLADQHYSHVGQRREVAARPDAPAGRHHRRHASVEHLAEPLGDDRPYAGEAFREHVGPYEHHGADFVACQRLARATAVRANYVALQLLEFIGRDAHLSEVADPGIDRVHRFIAAREALDHRARPQHVLRGPGAERHRFTAPRDGFHLAQRKALAVEQDHATNVELSIRGGDAQGAVPWSQDICARLCRSFSWLSARTGRTSNC